MKAGFRRTAAALCLVLCAACAPQAKLPELSSDRVDAEAKKQQEMAVRESMATLDRLNRVSWNILTKNVELCGERTSYALGMTLAEEDDFPKSLRPAAKQSLGLSAEPTVVQIVPGGPAQRAGLKPGDAVVSVGAVEVSSKEKTKKLMAEAAKKNKEVQVKIRRDGQHQDMVLQPVTVCAYEVRLKQDGTINAYADGENVTVLTGMMKFVRSDDELAAILGHEVAHNNQEHIRAMTGNMLLGQLLVDLPLAVLGVHSSIGANLGRQAFSQDFEFEADYVGLYFTARAGYDIHNVPDIWRRMAVENPGAITMGSTHPSTSKRFVALEAAAAEIDKKRADGLALRPEVKGALAKIEQKVEQKIEQKAEQDAAKDAKAAGSEAAPQ